MEPAPSAWLCRYHYDPLDRLAGTVTNNQQGVMCFYKKSRLATEINGALQRTVMEAGDQALAQQRMPGKVTETDLLATDQQRSVLRRVQPSGIESLGYAAYGYQPAQSGLDSVLGFTGERRDPVTGHYLLGNGYRAFNPVLMRFNSPDSLSPFGEGGLNAYAYCQGDPVNFWDPTGHVKSLILLAWNARKRILRPVSRAKRSNTALQLPRVKISPPSPLKSVVKRSQELKKANGGKTRAALPADTRHESVLELASERGGNSGSGSREDFFRESEFGESAYPVSDDEHVNIHHFSSDAANRAAAAIRHDLIVSKEGARLFDDVGRLLRKPT